MHRPTPRLRALLAQLPLATAAAALPELRPQVGVLASDYKTIPFVASNVGVGDVVDVDVGEDHSELADRGDDEEDDVNYD